MYHKVLCGLRPCFKVVMVTAIVPYLLQEFRDFRKQYFTLYILNVMLLVNTWTDILRVMNTYLEKGQ